VDRFAVKQAALAEPGKTIILLALAELFDLAKAKKEIIIRKFG
jgi:hypothetical protein